MWHQQLPTMPFRFLLYVIALLTVGASGSLAQHTTGRAPSQGVELYYHTYGDPDGAPVLILNGGPGISSEHFGFLAGKVGDLGAGYRTILFDQRGTGRSALSPINESTVTLDLMIQDIEALREHLGIEAWTILGHSWGGMYAMLYATAHPERVRGLILSASGGINLDWLDYARANIVMRLGPERRAIFERAHEPDYIAEDPARASRERVEAMATAYVYNPEHIPFVVEAFTRPGANAPEVRGLVYADLRRTGYDLQDALGGVAAPALLLHGRQDILGEEVPLQTHAALPNSELIWLNECSHYPWLDRPEAYFEAIADFLARVHQPAP